MSELHKFLFDGLPVRGAIVRLTDAWVEVLRRRSANTTTGAYADPVRDMLGEMAAAACLMQSSIKFDGSLVLQMYGDGPVKVAVVEVHPDLGFRATATVLGPIVPDSGLSQMVNQSNQGRCAITLDPRARLPGQQPYQGVVPLADGQGQKIERINAVLEHYMQQSEQLATTLVLAANATVAAGLLIQRLPMEGSANLLVRPGHAEFADPAEEVDEPYQRLAMLTRSLQPEELLNLDVDTVLRRLFWNEPMKRFSVQAGGQTPHFSCNCSRERVGKMIVGLGADEVQSILAQRADVEVACEFCGVQYRFDAIDAAHLFTAPTQRGAVETLAH
ncbi:MAG: Hsp33 family molecular chaperone HslO [Rhodoferax sp.]|nr:Hsp33 family molecular chaperone HslO [Rhodoferax sp.]